MQTEFGGSPLTVPLSYLSYSPVARTSQMRSSGLKGVVISHSVLDGEVTSDMGAQMAAALVATGIPTDVYTAVFKYPSTITGNGLTLDGDLIGTLDSSYSSPSAGHVSPVVLDAALSRLTALYSQGTAPSGVSLTLDDGQLGVVPLIP
jgi:hypothetical protein